jgi:sterol 3beta-glucosyltransferase
LINAVNIYIDYAEYRAAGKGLSSFARVGDDGRIIISLDLKQNLPDLPEDYAKTVEEFALDEKTWRDVPRMNIVIMIVGSRGTFVLYILAGLIDLELNATR